jgi:hypothetical protein
MQMALFWTFVLLATGAFVIFVIAVMEVGYRIRLKIQLDDRPKKTEVIDGAGAVAEGRSFWVMSMARELTDLTLGYRYRQGTHVYRTVHFVRGRFDHWDAHTFRADRPEISGAFNDDYGSADLKILVFGDSFTAVQSGFAAAAPDGNGATWPRLLQHRLEHSTGRRVRVANFARPGQGALQFIDLAAAIVPEWRPNLYIIAYTTNSLIRPRFWWVDRVLRGRECQVQSMSPNANADPLTNADASYYLQINPAITAEWCERMDAIKRTGDAAQLDNDPLARDLVENQSRMKREEIKPVLRVDLWNLHSSFVYNRIAYGDPFFGVARATTRITYGDTGLSRLDDDPGFRAAAERLLENGTLGLLVHLPHLSEVEKGTEFFYEGANGVPRDRGKSLRQSLEQALGTETIGLLPYMSEMQSDPMAFVLRPTDPHPNGRGLQLFADAVAHALLQRGLLP